MTDDDEFEDPFEARYQRDDAQSDQTAEPSETAENNTMSETSKTSKSAESGKTKKNSKTTETEKSGGVRSRKNVNMYLPDDLVDDLQLRYSELNVQWRREHGDDMPKNEEYYPAVIRSALNDTTIEAELGLE
jgi:hypothetical protein